MAAAAILDFQVIWIWLFRRVDSVVFVLCAKFGSNYSYRDRRTYASDIHLMMSRELTSGFDFWSRGHLRMAVMHLPIKFGAHIFIQSGVIDIFPKFKMAAAAILDFQVMWIWPFRHVDSDWLATEEFVTKWNQRRQKYLPAGAIQSLTGHTSWDRDRDRAYKPGPFSNICFRFQSLPPIQHAFFVGCPDSLAFWVFALWHI